MQDCWKGQDPELRTWILKSTETRETQNQNRSQYQHQFWYQTVVVLVLRSRGSELLRCFLNCSFRSLLTPMSWNILCSLDVYSKPHACCRRQGTSEPLNGSARTQQNRTRADLQFGDHAGLGVVAGAVLVDQTFGQHLGVELLEHIFVLDVLEHNHLREERRGAGLKIKPLHMTSLPVQALSSHHLVECVLKLRLLWVFGAEMKKNRRNEVFDSSKQEVTADWSKHLHGDRLQMVVH